MIFTRLRPEGAAYFDEEVEVVLAFSHGNDLGIVDELPGRKLDGASHGGHQRRFNEVVAGFQPQVTRAGAGAIVAEVVEGDAEDGKLYLNVEPIGEASLVVEKQGLGSIPAVEEIGDAVAVQEVTLARVLEHETDLNQFCPLGSVQAPASAEAAIPLSMKATAATPAECRKRLGCKWRGKAASPVMGKRRSTGNKSSCLG